MLNLCLRSSTVGLLVTLGLVALASCGNESLAAKDSGNKAPGPDGSVTSGDAIDAAACGCQVDGNTLTISMACYCAQYDCTQSPWTLSCSNVSYGIGCGILEVSAQTVGGLEKWVYNDERSLVGVQLATDDGVFTCPTDPSLQGFVLRAGWFPLDSCTSVTVCPCVDGKIGSCPPLDGGTSTAADGAAL